MVSFANPGFLWLVPLAPLVAWWWLRRRRPALRYSDTRLLDGLPRGRAGRARWASAVGRGAVVLLLAVAAAGPRVPDLSTPVAADGIAVVLVLDVSGSMGTADFAWTPGTPPVSRLEAAGRAFRLFVAGGAAPDGTTFDGRPADQVGLVTFAAVPVTACPLTLNHSVLLQTLDGLRPKTGVDAGTNIGDAIAEGLIRLTAAGDRRTVLVLLSDGEHNVVLDRPDPPLTPRPAAKLAANLGVPVYTLDCGGDPAPDASPDAARQRQDGRRVLEDVAELTGGRSFAADSGADLRAVYQQIDALERRPADSFQYRRYHEFYPWPAGLAFALLAAVTWLEATRWRRVP